MLPKVGQVVHKSNSRLTHNLVGVCVCVCVCVCKKVNKLGELVDLKV